MRIETFRLLAETYGGDLSHWPSDRQGPAASLLRSDPEAARILAEAREVDAWLDAAAVTVDDDRLARMTAAIAAGVDAVEAERRAAWQMPSTPAGRPVWSAAFLGMMGVLGLIVGVLAPNGMPSASTATEATSIVATTSIASLTDATGYYSTRYFVDGGR